MRKVFLENLPKWNDGKYKGKIDWKKSVGHNVKFIYDNIDGEIEILEYYGKMKLKLKYKNTEKITYCGSLTSTKIESLIGKYRRDHVRNVGDIVEYVNSGKLKILKQIRTLVKNEKGYEYECLICENIDIITESGLNNGNGCNVCCSNSLKILIGYNDIHTISPELGKLLWDFDDGYKYSAGSGRRINFKCPNCGNKIENKSISHINSFGLSCPRCSDGLSYPEKLVYNVLAQVGIEFDYQKKFDWTVLKNINNKKFNSIKRYDFYIPSLNCIVETHGGQHYKKTNIWRSLQDELDSDILKKKLADENGIDHYIIIDCQKSDLTYIKENILKSDLPNLINLKNVNWKECNEISSKSLVRVACEIFDKGSYTTEEIGKIMKLDRTTVRGYLKRGTEIGWCKYDQKEERLKTCLRMNKLNCKKIVVMTKSEEYIGEYNSMKEVVSHFKLSQSGVSMCCNGKYLSTGGFKMLFKEDYEKLLQKKSGEDLI